MTKSLQDVSIGGSNNNVSNGPMTVNYYQPDVAITQNRINDSAIVKVLTGLYDLVCGKGSTFNPIDTTSYSVEEKVKHNHLVKYKDDFDYYMEGHLQVSEKLGVISENEPTIIRKLDAYVVNLFVEAKRENGILPDAIVDKIILRITGELNGQASLTLEEISAIPIVVFDVFARCKIFEKPPLLLES